MARRDQDFDDVDEFDDDEEFPPRRRRYENRSIGDDPGMRLLLPVGRSPWAIIAGYLGLISILFFPAPFALGFGVLAIIDIKKHPEKHGMGRAIFGIVMGSLGSIGLIAIVVAIAFRHR
jgi:hypothetical protein